MGYIITIDAGTTNTRAFLWDENRRLAASAKSGVGVHITAIEGNNQKLKSAVRECLEALLSQAGIGYEQVTRIAASGMITANVGLFELPHICAPAGLEELAAGCILQSIPEVCPIPILFIPGVKNHGDPVNLSNYAAMDMMRGEEAETIAMLSTLPAGKEYLLVLPGSHTKFVRVNAAGQITGCLTTITGELLECITTGTVIADSVGREFVREDAYDCRMVLAGFDASRSGGIGRAAFCVRILGQFAGKDHQQLANYLLGAVLASDVQTLKTSPALCADRDAAIVVSGKNPLRRAIRDVLVHDGFFSNVSEFEPEADRPLSAMGACMISDRAEEIRNVHVEK